MHRTIITTVFVFGTLFLFVHGNRNTVYSQQPSSQLSKPAREFLEKYIPERDILHDMYVKDRKVRYETRYYTIDDKDGKVGEIESTVHFTYISDGRSLKLTVDQSSENNPSTTILTLWTSELYCSVSNQSGSNKIENVILAKTNSNRHRGKRGLAQINWPLSFGGLYGHLTEDYLTHVRPHAKVSVATTSWREKPAVAVTLNYVDHEKRNIKETAYFDPNNHLAAIGHVSNDFNISQLNQTGRIVTTIDYTPSDEGIPLPKLYTRQYELKNGTKLKIAEIEVLSYEKYEPSPEEFTLEEEYGLVTPVASDPTTHTTVIAPSRRWPWYLLIAGMAVMAVLIVAYWRRRRTALAA